MYRQNSFIFAGFSGSYIFHFSGCRAQRELTHASCKGCVS